ncbi:hypothetical protein [Tropicibacter sp. S64]|uniref:hypothetical protein n=1 Tax=Tropicibacter sp. S64 TaxID=3415122 RepID=UPI003C7B1A40
MKRTLAIALVAIAGFTGAANAMGNTPSAADLHTIQLYAPNADLSGLTSTKANQLLAVIQSGDSEGSKAFKVRTLLR